LLAPCVHPFKLKFKRFAAEPQGVCCCRVQCFAKKAEPVKDGLRAICCCCGRCFAEESRSKKAYMLASARNVP